MTLSFQKRKLYVFVLPLSLLFLSCFSSPLKDKEGDYKVFIFLENEPEKASVWIRNTVNHSANSQIREIVSPVILLSHDQSSSLAPLLLKDNYQTRIMGNWCFLPQEENSQVLLAYQVKASVKSDQTFVMNALKECAYASNTMKNVIIAQNQIDKIK